MLFRHIIRSPKRNEKKKPNSKWTFEENKRLLSIYKIKKNKWKDISVDIPNRNDNCVKNQFFALMRKALRKACKSIGMTHNTIKVNTIKPKVLLDFFDKNYNFFYNNRSANIQISSFIERHALSEKNNSSEKSDEWTELVNFLLENLISLKLPNK